MKLVKVTCELKYLERLKVLAGYEAIYMDLLKKKPESPSKWITPGLRLEDKDKRRLMVIDPMRSVIDIEEPPNIGFCRDSVMQFFKSLDSRVGIPQIARYGLRSTWLQEYEGNFKDLLDKCKQSIFGASSLVEGVDDVSASFDYYINDGKKLSVTTGPMRIEQLKNQFLVFEPQSLPMLFLYVDVDLGDTVTKLFSSQHLRDVFDKAIEEGEKLSSQVNTEIGRKQ